MTEMRHIGRETKRILGEDILTGKAMYTGDFHPANMHYGKILHSPHPFARIRSIDYSRAMAMPGVKCVVTHADIDPDLSINNGYTPPRHPNVLDEYVRFVGDAVALVVAETEDIAEEACKLIDVDYEVLTPVFNMDDALKPDAPQLYKVFPATSPPTSRTSTLRPATSKRASPRPTMSSISPPAWTTARTRCPLRLP